MREKALNWKGNKVGLSVKEARIYASTENHSSLDKAIWFSGIGEDNLVRVPVYGAYRSMDFQSLCLFQYTMIEKKDLFPLELWEDMALQIGHMIT